MIQVSIAGQPLDKLMEAVWPYLSETRRRQYNRLLREVRVANEERLAVAHSREMAAMRPDEKTTQAEWLAYLERKYKNEDPAVQLVSLDGSVWGEDVTKARAARANEADKRERLLRNPMGDKNA